MEAIRAEKYTSETLYCNATDMPEFRSRDPNQRPKRDFHREWQGKPEGKCTIGWCGETKTLISATL